MQTKTPHTLLDSAGRPLQLGPQLGAGGEGAVFELRDRSDLVVKLYHKGLEPEKATKITQMARAANERLLKLTAWPTEPIRAGLGGGTVVGFAMPKITGHKQAFSLYSPKLRLQEFPKASWQFLIRSAANAARAFAVIHESGHVIGDVNHGNLFVGDRATVRLIDCDSYQITVNGSRWFCEVGTPTHQPPELQNVKTYKGILRTPNHDNFGLAVIIFQMLFMARHPFSGRFLGSGEMPMERAISEYRFAYGSNATAIFQVPLVGSAQAGFMIAALWGKVTSIANPGPPPAFPGALNRTLALSPEGLELQRATLAEKIASDIRAMIGLDSRLHSLKKEIQNKCADARSRWQHLQSNWNASTSGKDYEDQLSSLQRLRTKYEALPHKRTQALSHLESNRHRLQLHTHLDARRISHARIKGIGDARKATLQSYGIETAADISDQRVLAVPGFGPVALKSLQQWRDQQEQRFRFDPNKGVDQNAKNKVEREILTERIDLERKLNDGLSKLTVSSNSIITRRRTFLAQAEQASLDIAQAEADLRGSSTISEHIIPKKWAIGVLVAASIGSFMFAARWGTPSPTVSQPTASHVISPIAPTRPTLPPHVETDPKGQWLPEDGYAWADANHRSTRWTPGKASRKTLHVIASDTEGKWEPEDGYDWVDPDRGNDKSTKWAPGTPSSRYAHLVAGAVEGEWQPAEGFTWTVNPPRVGDMRVRPNGLDEEKAASTPADLFQRGVADRAEMEQWVAGLSGEFRRGVDWWAARRSIPNPGSCSGPAATSAEFISGCEAAKARLTTIDIRRKSDPEYRRGWNIPPGAPISPPSAQANQPAVTGPPLPLINQAPPTEAPGSDADLARRLNEQELRRLRGQ